MKIEKQPAEGPVKDLMPDAVDGVPNFSNLIRREIARGYTRIAYRDPGEPDLMREIARWACQKTGEDRILIVAGSLSATIDMRRFLRIFQGPDTSSFPVSQKRIEVGTLRQARRIIEATPKAYRFIVLLSDLESSTAKHFVSAARPEVFIDTDPSGGPLSHTAGSVLYRDREGDMKTLQSMNVDQNKIQ